MIVTLPKMRPATATVMPSRFCMLKPSAMAPLPKLLLLLVTTVPPAKAVIKEVMLNPITTVCELCEADAAEVAEKSL